ncbi:class I SAM-dependent methyltransferase [Deinococcus sp.]|uniref:class I SAM-dependent methyltransferase n=1 Tax=Deinococcus sp. TaxID=47478 RepID=UPI003C7DE225
MSSQKKVAPPRRTLKIGTARPRPAPEAAVDPHSGARRGYFETYPAELPPKLSNLRRGVATKAGVRGAPGLDPAQTLLAATMFLQGVRGEVLDLTAMGGLIGCLPGVTLRAVEGSAPALAALVASGQTPTAAIPGDDLSGNWVGRAGVVALVLAGDRGNAYAEAQIAWAHASTPPGGTLYLAGDKDKGFDRYVRRASGLFGTGETIAREGGMRVAKLVRRPGLTPPQPAAEQYDLDGLKIVGLPGVFSAGKLDKATALLLEVLDDTDLNRQRVLDLGCGAGVIGAWAAARGAEVTLLDADLQSVRSAEATLAASTLAARVLHSDVDAALDETDFDLVLSNPPFHVGRGVVLDITAEFVLAAARRLRPGGRLVLVANEFLPYERLLAGWENIQTLATQGGFKVLSAQKA